MPRAEPTSPLTATGYRNEDLPNNLAATAVAVSITCAGSLEKSGSDLSVRIQGGKEPQRAQRAPRPGRPETAIYAPTCAVN